MTAAAAARQTRTGLALAAAIVVAWLAIHFSTIFLWRPGVGALPFVLLVMVVQTWLSTGLFIIAHDAMHGSLAPGRPRVNRAIGTLSLALYAGLSYRALHPKHHLHHRHAGSEGDPDFHAADQQLVAWFVAFFREYYSHWQIARITVAATVYLLLGASLLNIVLFWAVPALGAALQLFVFGTWLPHRHAGGPFADQHRARSSRFSPLVSLVTCFHFGGYHHEHHLSPGTPWWRLPRARTASVNPSQLGQGT